MISIRELYYVVVVKNDYVCSLEAGPLISSELAEAVIPTLPSIGGACRYALATQEVSLTVTSRL